MKMRAEGKAISLRLAGSFNEIINACLFFVLMLLCGAWGAALAITCEPRGAMLGWARKAFKMKKHSAVKGYR
jgi:hypothetical protein